MTDWGKSENVPEVTFLPGYTFPFQKAPPAQLLVVMSAMNAIPLIILSHFSSSISPLHLSPSSLASSMLPTATAVATGMATHLLFWLRLLHGVRGRSLYLISPTHRLAIGVIKGDGVTNHEAFFTTQLGTWNGHITIGVVQWDADGWHYDWLGK